MSAPAIGIGHPVSHPPRRPPRGPRASPPMCAPQPRDLMARSFIAVFGILHMPYGIRNSEIQNRESGYSDFSMP